MRLITGLLALTLAAAAGCSPDPTVNPSPATTPPVTTPSPEPEPSAPPTPSTTDTTSANPTASATTTLTPDQRAAADAVITYFRIQEEIDADLNADLQPLMEITDGNMRRMVTENLTTRRSQGLIVRGSSTYDIHRVDDPESVGGEQQIAVYVCMDSSDVETIDSKTGEPAAGVDPPRYLDYRLIAADRGGWKLVDGGNKEVKSCP